MLFKLKSYFKFLLKSTNEHGVHSPFVFNYLTKCLYKKPRKSKDKTLDILLKSIAYFKFTKINVIGNSVFKKELEKKYPNLVFDAKNPDLLFYENSEFVKPVNVISHSNLHNDSIIILNNIHKNSKSHNYWSNFKKWKEVSVSIDMYYCGVIFIRREQQKEHFTIRI
ncbi:hypothetical protein [uncultured Croceitalea sp.]|uniref:hypothetical protein n=1 Tax=uncultured Croceitalea sp. TaxID=1798908 RepID=UPI003306600E